jgi:hypothetical protein
MIYGDSGYKTEGNLNSKKQKEVLNHFLTASLPLVSSNHVGKAYHVYIP